MIGFLGGTFDPIHLGHIHLAKQVLENKIVSKVVFSPANVSPLKLDKAPIATASQRVDMLNLALEGQKNMELSVNEIQRPPPSYTIDVIKNFKHGEVRLILGGDCLEKLSLWKDVNQLLSLAPPIIIPRTKTILSCKEKFYVTFPFHKADFYDFDILPISSSQLRILNPTHSFCISYLPPKVLDYICQNQLYFSF